MQFCTCSGCMLEKKVDLLLHESFAEKPNELNQVPSVNDKTVLNKFQNSMKNIGGGYEIAFPFKEKNINLPNYRSYTMNRMVNLE